MDVQTPLKKKRSPDYFAETSEKAPRPAATKIEEGDDKKQVIHEKDLLRVLRFPCAYRVPPDPIACAMC